MKTIHTRLINNNRAHLLGAVEGYYGPPLDHAARIELIRWLGARGFNSYAYAPKDDPFHRARWREPYPADRLAQLAELVTEGERAGMAVALVLSPGLDWGAPGDEDALVAKMATYVEAGARVLGVAFDDVPPGGAELGASHARGVAAAAKRFGDDIRWVTCPTDYATDTATPYLRAFSEGLPDGADIMWTGPSIVSPTVDGETAARVGKEIGRPLLFAENYPVNDGPMAGVLHLGPYRGRSPDLPAATTGVFFNFMSFALASRVGLAAGARFWLDPSVDAEASWRECLSEFPGIEPLARASRGWIGDPGPDAELEAWARAAIDGDVAPLRAFLDKGCRAGLDADLAAEVEPWLAQWEAEALAMHFAMFALHAPPEHRLSAIFATAEAWARARHSRLQLFGTRWAYYPLTERRGDATVACADALIQGANLTDLLCRRAVENP